MSYPFRDIKIVDVYDMLHGFDGHYYRSAEIHLDIGLRMNHYGFRNCVDLPFLGTQQTVMCPAVVESFLQPLGVISDSVSHAAEDFRCNLQGILPVSRRASSLDGKARRHEKEDGYQSFHNNARYKKQRTTVRMPPEKFCIVTFLFSLNKRLLKIRGTHPLPILTVMCNTLNDS